MGFFDRFKKYRPAPDPDTHQKLVQLMHGLSQADTPKGRSAFYKELLASSLRIAVPGAIAWQGLPAGDNVAIGGTTIRFLASPGPDGKPGMLVFTGPEAVWAWREAGCDTVELETPELCRLALGAGMEYLIINPRGPSGGMLGLDDIKALSERRLPRASPRVGEKESLPPDEHIVFSRPPFAPSTEMSAALRAEASQRQQILAAYMVQSSIGDATPRLLLAVELEAGADPDKVIPSFLEGALRRLQVSDVKPPDAMPVEPGSALLKAAREHGWQVYFKRR